MAKDKYADENSIKQPRRELTIQTKQDCLGQHIAERLKRFESNTSLSIKDIDIIWGDDLDGNQEIFTVKVIIKD